jgi:glycosyltransferase involved in cell wall biosynthesis
MTRPQPRLIKIFTPSYADAGNTNAQNLTVKEIVARLPEDRFHVTMLCEGDTDLRLRARRNTQFVPWRKHGNTIRLLRHCLLPPPDIYFFPRTGPLDRIFFDLRNRIGLQTLLITYIVMAMNVKTSGVLIRRSVLEGDVVVGNSKHVCATIQQMFGVHAGPIYDGVDRRYFFPPPQPSTNEKLVVLYAGSFQPRKRVEVLIRQASRLPELQFRLAGAGETERACRQLVQELGCHNVSFLGHLSSDRLGEEMRKADVFLFPSILEGNPQVLLQASACGVPCIAMDLYRTDYVVNGKTGFLAETDNDLTESLDKIVGDASLRKAFAAAAISHASQFDWNDIAAQWAERFEESVAKRQLKFQRAS